MSVQKSGYVLAFHMEGHTPAKAAPLQIALVAALKLVVEKTVTFLRSAIGYILNLLMKMSIVQTQLVDAFNSAQ